MADHTLTFTPEAVRQRAAHLRTYDPAYVAEHETADMLDQLAALLEAHAAVLKRADELGAALVSIGSCRDGSPHYCPNCGRSRINGEKAYNDIDAKYPLPPAPQEAT